MHLLSRFQPRNARCIAAATAAFLVSALTLSGLASPARAAEAGIINKGDAVVTAFPGVKTDANVPADVHPLDRTFIDLDGPSAKVFDLSVLGTAPRGELSDVVTKLQIKAGDVGQVFGVTLDDGMGGSSPNAYLASSSMFGLQIVGEDGEGGTSRLVKGQPGAKWMPGQFALDKGGSPGAIWKIDGATGAASLFANIRSGQADNSGPGLGAITFDSVTRQLFVADLESGLIHRLALDGRDLGTFDHGTAGRTSPGLDAVADDPARRMSIASPAFKSEDTTTWGYADPRRRVFGLAVNKNRLYYAVAEGPSIWSVALDQNGGFGSDARIELEIPNAPPGTDITHILFDDQGRMYLSQRGPVTGSYDYKAFAAPQQSLVLRYTWSEPQGRWVATPEEYAIGLAPDHHETQGGIALNYGYDKNGNIDYGTCRQTLWTTGEHLREGEDAIRVSTGGANIVHGLQGNYISSVRVQNEAPYQTWFTDYDSRFSDADSYGQIGDVAIFSPCTPAIQAQPYMPPADNPGLVLNKVCFASPIGGKVKCTITVQNVSDHVASSDVTIKEVTKVWVGPNAGGILPIVQVNLPDLGIKCSAVPSPDFACTIPAALLIAGGKISLDVFVDTQDTVLAGNAGFQNCATMISADGNGKACAKGGGDIVVEKVGPGTCLPGGTCKFGLKIANKGLEAFDGDVLLADAMTVGGGVQNVPVVSVSPAIACSAGNVAQLPFTCATHVSLLPGEEHVHSVEVTMPAPGDYWAENCFGALDPALIPVGPLPPGFIAGGGKGNPSCVWVHVVSPKPNLAIQKSVVGNGQCDKTGNDLFCKYDVTLTNQNNADFNDVLKFDETVPAGGTISAIDAPWACAGGPPTFSCGSGGALLIPAGASVATQVTVQIPVPDVEALGCSVPNTVKISQPPAGVAPNVDPNDDTSSATAWTAGLSWVDPITQQTHVLCDPTNLKVQKVAKGPCTKAGSNWKCGYDITVTNEGPDDYKGPVSLAEEMGGNPTSVAFNGDFNCTGGGGTYACSTPVISLFKHKSLSLSVEASVPDDGTCRVANTVKIVAPKAGSKGNGDGSDDIATAIAKVPSERCGSEILHLTNLPSCEDGRPRRLDGSCPCPRGWGWNERYAQCEPPKIRCFDPDRRRGDGTCCPSGTVYDERANACRIPQPICGDPERRRDDGTCCPYGTVVSASGNRCVIIDQACPAGTRWNYIFHTCLPLQPVCRFGETYNWRRQTCEPVKQLCPFGFRYDRDIQKCVPIVFDCPFGQRWNGVTHRCEGRGEPNGAPCGPGKHRVGAFCVPDRDHGGDNNGNRPCPQGKHRVGTFCVPDIVIVPNGGGSDNTPCPEGKHRIGKICVPNRIDPTPSGGTDLGPCPRGQHRVGKLCMPDVIKIPNGGNVDPGCPAGQHRQGRECVPNVIKLPNGGGDVTIVCPSGKHRVGRECVPDTIKLPNGGGNVTTACPAGKHRVGTMCVPDRIITIPGNDRKPLILTCPGGQRRVGNACVPNIILPKNNNAPIQQKLLPKAPTFRAQPPKHQDGNDGNKNQGVVR